MSDTLKNAVDTKLPTTKDISTLKSIYSFMQNYFDPRPSHLTSSSRHLTSVSEIEKLGNNFLDDCSEYAMVFTAIARHLGFETTYVQTVNSEWMASKDLSKVSAHVFVEVKVGDKLVIVDSSTGEMDVTYDRDELTIKTNSTGNGTGYNYVWMKSINSIHAETLAKAENNFLLELSKVFDMSLMNKSTGTALIQ